MRTIYLSELAALYFPRSTTRSATVQLRKWVKLNTDLRRRLAELHWQEGQRTLTPLQHAAFIEFLGEP